MEMCMWHLLSRRFTVGGEKAHTLAFWQGSPYRTRHTACRSPDCRRVGLSELPDRWLMRLGHDQGVPR